MTNSIDTSAQSAVFAFHESAAQADLRDAACEIAKATAWLAARDFQCTRSSGFALYTHEGCALEGGELGWPVLLSAETAVAFYPGNDVRYVKLAAFQPGWHGSEVWEVDAVHTEILLAIGEILRRADDLAAGA